MSYFSRLVLQSQLEVAGMPKARPLPRADAPAWEAGADLMEVEEVREVSTPPLPVARPQEAGAPPSAAAPLPALPPPPSQRPGGEVQAEAQLPAAPPGEPSSAEPHLNPPAPAGEVLHQVMRWVASGPQSPAAETPRSLGAAARGEPPAGPSPAPGAPAPGESAPEDRAGPPPERALRASAADPGVREVPAAPPPPPAPPLVAAPAPAGRARPAAGPVEELVEISIGTISVRVEGPAREASPAAPPPRPAPAPARPAPPSAPRLARHYLRP